MINIQQSTTEKTEMVRETAGACAVARSLFPNEAIVQSYAIARFLGDPKTFAANKAAARDGASPAHWAHTALLVGGILGGDRPIGSRRQVGGDRSISRVGEAVMSTRMMRAPPRCGILMAE
jgi:hypothetical protein